MSVTLTGEPGNEVRSCLLKASQQVCDRVMNRTRFTLNTGLSPYISMPHHRTPSATLTGIHCFSYDHYSGTVWHCNDPLLLIKGFPCSATFPLPFPWHFLLPFAGELTTNWSKEQRRYFTYTHFVLVYLLWTDPRGSRWASVPEQKEMLGACRSRMAGLCPSRTAGHGVGLTALLNRTLPF